MKYCVTSTDLLTTLITIWYLIWGATSLLFDTICCLFTDCRKIYFDYISKRILLLFVSNNGCTIFNTNTKSKLNYKITSYLSNWLVPVHLPLALTALTSLRWDRYFQNWPTYPSYLNYLRYEKGRNIELSKAFLVQECRSNLKRILSI